MKFNKKKILYWAALISVGFFVIYVNKSCDKDDEIDRLKIELAHAQIYQPVQIDTIRDSIYVLKTSVSEVDRSSYKKSLVDKNLIKDLQLKARQVLQDEKLVVCTHDTVKIISKMPDVFDYKDLWATFHLSLTDSLLSYSVFDSIQTFIYREYKHKFLWWKWGIKCYKVKVVNYNPHSIILHNQVIKVD